MVDIDEVHEAIEAGHTTTGEIAEYLGNDDSHTARELKQFHEDGLLAREKDGRSYSYYIPAETPDQNGGDSAAADGGATVAQPNAQAAASGGVAAGPAPANAPNTDLTVEDLQFEADYDWSEFVPEGTPEYIPTDGEYDEIRALIDGVETFGQPAHVRMTGPTGAGKTHLPTYLAEEDDAPLFTIAVKHALDSTDLLGRFVYVGGETRWINGPLTKAILASQERKVYLLLDEVNRARPEAKSALFEALDDRAQVTLDALGGETVSGNAENIVLFSTMNVGRDHITEELDLAEVRRLGVTYNVDHLGVNHPERERDLIADRTGCHEALAEEIVDFGNEVRELARDNAEQVQRGVPTGMLIELAQVARKFADGGISNPLVRAGKAQVVRPLFVSDGRAERGKDTVEDVLTSIFDGCPADAVLDRDEFNDWRGKDIEDDLDMGSDPDAAL